MKEKPRYLGLQCTAGVRQVIQVIGPTSNPTFFFCSFRCNRALSQHKRIPDVEFFLNKRDHPQLKKTLTEPYDFIFDRDDQVRQQCWCFDVGGVGGVWWWWCIVCCTECSLLLLPFSSFFLARWVSRTTIDTMSVRYLCPDLFLLLRGSFYGRAVAVERGLECRHGHAVPGNHSNETQPPYWQRRRTQSQ